jgi:hypothetical protein
VLIFFVFFSLILSALQVFETIITKIYQKNYFTKLKYSTSLPVSKRAKSSSEEPVDHIQQARTQWEAGLIEELGAIAAEAKRPFLLIR